MNLACTTVILTLLCCDYAAVSLAQLVYHASKGSLGPHAASSANVPTADCSSDRCPDKIQYDSIRSLHHQLDDDANGDIDISETDEFIRDELQYENGNERRKGFHGNDKHISLAELWQAWKGSEVHNWTTEDTINWLITSVELPQYVKTFQDHGVNGTILPTLATNNAQFIANILGVKDPIHRQKIVLKAMDAVLFGSSKADRNFMKDLALVLLLLVSIGVCWFAYVQHRYSQRHLKKMIADMEALQKAEDSLMDMQHELDKARQEQENVADEKRKLESKLKHQTSKDYVGILTEDDCYLQMRILEDQVETLQSDLDRAERMLEQHQSQWLPPPSLQLWLQLTYEVELKNYTVKKNAAEHQLFLAKEGCDKLRKKKTQMFGSFRIAHGSSIDDIDRKIYEAKTALSEVTQDLKERLQRWQQVEILCGFPIVQNPGMSYLQSLLYGSLDGRAKLINSARAILNRKDSSDALLEDDLSPSAVQRLVSMSANLFLAPVPPQGVKSAAPSHNRGNGHFPAFNKSVHLIKSRSSNQIKTNGSLARDLTFPVSLHATSHQSSPSDSHHLSESHSMHLPPKTVTVEQIVEANDSSDDVSSNVASPISSRDSNDKPVFSLGSPNDSSSQLANLATTDVQSVKQADSRAPNSRQSSSDSFNPPPSSHENSVSPPRNGSHRRNKLSSLFKSKSGSNVNLVSTSTPPDDCSTDSGSVNEEIKHKKKRMFLHLKKSKPKKA